jgi:ABC-2 type transport system permease protein
LILMPIESITTTGAFVYAFAIGASGIFFAAFALLMAQLFSSARGANAGAMTAMGLFFLLRAVGDTQGNALSWISPMGLPMQTYSFYQNRVLPIIILLVLAAVIAAIALLFCKKRDLGEGLIPARKGKGEASRLLLSPLGFAWRMSRGSFIGWAVALFSFGAMYGAALQMEDFLEIEMLQTMVETLGELPNLLHGFVSILFMMMALLSAVPVMICAKRVFAEEKHHRLEQLYARAVPRTKMLFAFMGIAGVFSVVMPLLSALGMYAASAGATGLSLRQFLQASLAYVPAIWVMLGLCVLLIGLWPKGGWLAWALFGVTFFFNYMGRLAFPEDIADFTARLTPFGQIPQMPVHDFAWLPLVMLTIIAAGLCAAGALGYRKRDIYYT